jgi:hypothetical protein
MPQPQQDLLRFAVQALLAVGVLVAFLLLMHLT